MGILLLGTEDRKVRKWKDAKGVECDIWAQGGQVMVASADAGGIFNRKVLTIQFIKHYIENQLLAMAKAKRGLQTARSEESRQYLHAVYQDADRSLEVMGNTIIDALAQGDPFDPRVARDRAMQAEQKYNYRRTRDTNAHIGDLSQYQHGLRQLGVWDPAKLPWRSESNQRKYVERLKALARQSTGNRIVTGPRG